MLRETIKGMMATRGSASGASRTLRPWSPSTQAILNFLLDKAGDGGLVHERAKKITRVDNDAAAVARRTTTGTATARVLTLCDEEGYGLLTRVLGEGWDIALDSITTNAGFGVGEPRVAPRDTNVVRVVRSAHNPASAHPQVVIDYCAEDASLTLSAKWIELTYGDLMQRTASSADEGGW